MTVEANDDSLPAKTSTILTGQFISLTDYLCHNNETGLCAAELSFNNNIAMQVCNAVIPACRPQRWMRTATESVNYSTLKTDTMAYSRAVDLVKFELSMIRCLIKNNLFLNLCGLAFESVWAELICQRCVKSHLKHSGACPILSLQGSHPTGKDSLRGKRGLILSLMQPQQQQDITRTC